MKRIIISAYLFISLLSIYAHGNENGYHGTHRIVMPDIPGYMTLTCDFHTHTVFSDGFVWPTIRVDEAVRGGIDAIAITDHIEYLPHKGDVNTDHNRSNEIATKYAKGKGVLVIPGAEITRSMPPGHCNALFIQDANKLVKDDVMEVFEEAKRQGAYIMWNHPAWIPQRPDGMVKVYDMHEQLLKKGYMQGIEVFNAVMTDYSDEALKVALKYNLVPMSTSDIHGLGEWEWSPANHRPVTLIFAKEKSLAGIKEALINKRAVAYNGNYLVGSSYFLERLFKASIDITEAKYRKNVAYITIKNNSDVDFHCVNKSPYTLHSTPYFFTIKAQSTTSVQVKTIRKMNAFDFQINILNLIHAPGKGLETSLHITTR